MDLTGTTIGGVDILKPLGAGAVGQVYEGMQRSLDRGVAVKILAPQHTESPEFIERFLREAKIAAKLNHSNIVHVYDAGRAEADRGEPEGLFYIVMELVPGKSLRDLLQEKKLIPVEQALRWMTQAAEGLGCAHRAGLIHRDVKPGNLILGPDDEVKVADFGLARSDESASALTQSGTVLGTPSYMSPEQCEGHAADARSDLYSLGATFYHIIAGHAPFEAESIVQVMYKHCSAPRPVLELEGDTGKGLSSVIQRLMAVDPGARYQSAADLLAELSRLELGLGPVASVSATDMTLAMGGPDRIAAVAKGPQAASAETLEIEARGDGLAERGQWAMAAAAYREALAADPANRSVQDKLLSCDIRVREESFRDLLSVAEKHEAAGRYAEAADSYGRALRAAEGAGEQDRIRLKFVEMRAAAKSQKTRSIVMTVVKVPAAIITLAVIYYSATRIIGAWEDYERKTAEAERRRLEKARGPDVYIGELPGAPALRHRPPAAGEERRPREVVRPASPAEPTQLETPPRRERGPEPVVTERPEPRVAAPRPRPAPQPEVDPWSAPLTKTVDLPTLHCEFKVPESWREVSNPPAGASYAMQLGAGRGSRAGLTLRVLRSNATAEAFGKATAAEMQRRESNYTAGFAYNRMIGGKQAFEFSGRYAKRDGKVECLVTVVRAGDFIYELKLTTHAAQFGRAKKRFREIAKTFRYTR